MKYKRLTGQPRQSDNICNMAFFWQTALTSQSFEVLARKTLLLSYIQCGFLCIWTLTSGAFLA